MIKWFAVFLVASTLCCAEDITLTSGKVLRNATVIRRDPATATIRHSTGVERISFDRLPRSIWDKYEYDPLAAAVFLQEEKWKAESVRYRQANPPDLLPSQEAVGVGEVESGSGCLSVGRPAARTIDETYGWLTVSVAVSVRNSCGKSGEVVVRVQAVDGKGFEVTSERLSGTVSVGATTVISDRTILKKEVAAQIEKWQVKSASLD